MSVPRAQPRGVERSAVTIGLDGSRLDVRPSVACREARVADGTLFYLSLLDDEIDDRVDRFLEETALKGGFEATAPHLELTDAVVFSGGKRNIVVVRGGSCTFPLFWSRQKNGVHLSTSLPLERAKFSSGGLVSGLAAACLDGSYEPNGCAETPLQGWRRVRRGVVTSFGPDTAFSERVVVQRGTSIDSPADEEVIAEEIRAAFAGFAQSQRHVTSSVVELSGGFDSTLAAATACSPLNTIRGISVTFPYYEFRLEAPLQSAVGDALGISRAALDGVQLFPYAPSPSPPRFDEPEVFVTGIRHAEEVASYAASHHATRIYVGHGGDQLFATDLTAIETVPYRFARGAFARDGWFAVCRAIERVREPRLRQRASGCFVYHARQDVWVKEAYGVCLRTPFSDLALFRAALGWSRWSASRHARPDKSILVQALPDLLPRVVAERKGKVAYDGVWMRAYEVHAGHIMQTLDRASAVLEHVGLSPSWLLRRARQLANWQPVPDREVLATYALATWLIKLGRRAGSRRGVGVIARLSRGFPAAARS